MYYVDKSFWCSLDFLDYAICRYNLQDPKDILLVNYLLYRGQLDRDDPNRVVVHRDVVRRIYRNSASAIDNLRRFEDRTGLSLNISLHDVDGGMARTALPAFDDDFLAAYEMQIANTDKVGKVYFTTGEKWSPYREKLLSRARRESMDAHGLASASTAAQPRAQGEHTEVLIHHP